METLTDTRQNPAIAKGLQDGANLADNFRHIPGWGMDADPENDPTYPMKHANGADHQRINYERAPQQTIDREVLISIERPEITRVFGTSVPPSGLSGSIRRYAFKYSEATLAHWMGLIFADRVNAIEGRLEDLAQGIIPNPWKERGWGAEWKYNRKNFVQKIATGVLITTVVVGLIARKRSRA